MNTEQKLQAMKAAFEQLIADVKSNTVTEPHKKLIIELLQDWHHGERMSLLLSDPTVSTERIEEEYHQ